MDKVVQELVALGVPGLVLLVVVATSGLAGGAAIVAALAEHGLALIFKAVVKGLQAKGMSKKQIRAEVESYPITKFMRAKILE